MIRALELFCGIGGFATAIANFDVQIVGAFDQNPAALATYRLNFPDHPARQSDLKKITAWELTAPAADLWWISPPCQPYCERGCKRDLDDPRAKSLLHIMEMLARIPAEKLPVNLALENVAGFSHSSAHEKLVRILSGRGYSLRERLLCPTELGVPSRRPRYYLAASLLPFTQGRHPQLTELQPLSNYLDWLDVRSKNKELRLASDIVDKFGMGLRILDPDDPSACTTCFTAGYGRSVAKAGSYLVCDDMVRYFSPEEIARLLHFHPSFRFPDGMPMRKKWHLAGNSLSVVAVREILRSFSNLAETG